MARNFSPPDCATVYPCDKTRNISICKRGE